MNPRAPAPRSKASEDSSREDIALVQGCRAGNEKAWNTLIDKYKNLIYSVCLRYRLSPEDAADVVQGVCLELFSSLDRLRKLESLRSWLITVAVHKSLLLKRQRQRRGENELPEEHGGRLSEENTPGSIAAEVEREQIVREAARGLGGRCGELVRMLFFEEPPVPYAEAARRLGLATGSIGFIRGRCLKRLRERLEKAGL